MIATNKQLCGKLPMDDFLVHPQIVHACLSVKV
jgi:hypothetical protein